jgi:hypothetical protein
VKQLSFLLHGYEFGAIHVLLVDLGVVFVLDLVPMPAQELTLAGTVPAIVAILIRCWETRW